CLDKMSDSSPKVVDVKLKRGSAGLGFNIVGGVDQHYVANDSGIYVSKIKEDGPAALDGRLQEGDKILTINGVILDDRTHKDAVELFITAGDDVELRLPTQTNGPTGPQPEIKLSVSPLGILAALVGAATPHLMSLYNF
uniref:Synaptojanin-2-binding protein n=1 Tax=Mola mola TaxID=94237 RepID=A0A3Q3WKA9_MOLML